MTTVPTAPVPAAWRRCALRLTTALAIAIAIPPAAARAHEVEAEVVRGGAVAVRVTHSNGEPLADDEAQIFSPRDGRTPHQRGRTDRNGWVSFVPDAPGSWRVRVFEPDGHGIDTRVEIDRVHARAADHGHDGGFAVVAPGLRLLRPAIGVLAIMAVFVGLYLWRRRGRR